MTGGFHDDDPLDHTGVPSPDDRLWRHPSEVAAARASAPPPPHRNAQRPWLVAGLGGAVGAALTAGTLALGGAFTPDVIESPVTRPPVVPVSMTLPEEPAISVAGRTATSLARIEATVGDQLVTGSAIVHDRDGHLITNAHVVDGASTVVAVLIGEQRQEAEVVGVDRATDLAVLRLPAPAGLTPVRLRADVPARVGELTIAMGSPLGLPGPPTASTGIVGGHRSRVETTDGRVLYGLIQTDADITAGSSGGALFDADGLLIGVTTAVVAADGNAGGLSFAVPADQVARVVDELIATGRVNHAWMGIEGDADSTEPARVTDVSPAGPAASSGLAEDDVITTIDDQPTASMADVILVVRKLRPGDRIDVEYVRDGRTHTCRVVLAERPT